MPHLREHASATPTARLALLSLLLCSLTSSTALTVALGPSVCLRAATPLRAVHALCSSDDGPKALLRQSEVLELLSEVTDPSLADLSGSTAGADVVTLGLVRGVSTEAGSCKLELELPELARAWKWISVALLGRTSTNGREDHENNTSLRTYLVGSENR